MRCFIAVDLPKEIKDYLYNLENKIRDSNAKISFVAKKNLHLTLKFLGDVDENIIKELKGRLSKIKSEKFKVKLSNLGIFPNEAFIRVIWIGLKPADKIMDLQRKIDYELLDLFNKDQEFSAHLTLGRVKFIKDKKKLLESLRMEIDEKEFDVSEFKLMKSDLSKDGPSYSEIERYMLE